MNAKGKNYYRGEAYWEKESPRTASTGQVMLSYFPKAGKLQIARIWVSKATSEVRRGKTITLDQEDLQLYPEARKLLERVLEDWKEV